MTKHSTPAYLKCYAASVSLPTWYRFYLPHVHAKSHSKALSMLVDYAIRHGAIEALAPDLPAYIRDPGALAAYLTGNPPPAVPPANAHQVNDQAHTAPTIEQLAGDVAAVAAKLADISKHLETAIRKTGNH